LCHRISRLKFHRKLGGLKMADANKQRVLKEGFVKRGGVKPKATTPKPKVSPVGTKKR
jgi:hypothetical protein